MAEISDDKLMAYADGSLDALTAFERVQIEAALRSDPDARRRFDIFRATGSRMAPLFETGEPVPAHLKNFVLNYPIERKAAAPAARPAAKLKSLRASLAGYWEKLAEKADAGAAGAADWLSARIAPPARWQVGVVMASALAVGPVAGWFAHRSADPNILVSFKDGRVYAAGALRRVLEEVPSGDELRIDGAAASDAVTMRANLTFKTDNGWCREYETSASRTGSFVGLGCRDADGRWALTLNLPKGGVSSPLAPHSKPAAGKKPGEASAEELDAIVDRIMVGDALGRSAEETAIANRWK